MDKHDSPDDHQSLSNETDTFSVPGSPAVPAGAAGTSGTAAGTAEPVPVNPPPGHSILPGFEKHFPPLPLELDFLRGQ